MKYLFLLFLFTLLACASVQNSQSESHATYMTIDDPLCNLWMAYEYTEEEEEERYEKYAKHLNSNEIDESFNFIQEFIFFLPGSDSTSMMSPFEMEGMGFACPSYFNAKKDDTHLYFEVFSTCELGRTPEELKGKVAYKYIPSSNRLLLYKNNIPYDYILWEPK